MAGGDFAIVVGVRRYPRIKPPQPGKPDNLDGPDRDATAIYEWLTDSAGGAVPESNALQVRSQDFPQSEAQPDERDIEGAFRWLLAQEQPNARIGRRLYLYFSGHGFGMDRSNGGLYTAAADPTMREHFYATAWFEWFYKAALFEEYVFWFDACMTRLFVPAPRVPALATRVDSDYSDGRVFSAFAARHPRKAVERTMPDGQVHGAFTHTLLKGLRGDAADPDTNVIDSASLRKYLRENMKLFLTERDLNDPDVSNEPDFGFTDEMVLASVANVPATVQFRFRQSDEGKTLRVERGEFNIIASGVVTSAAWQASLEKGIYRLVVGSNGSSRLFEVTGDQGNLIDMSQ